jgi:hypothetical protein
MLKKKQTNKEKGSSKKGRLKFGPRKNLFLKKQSAKIMLLHLLIIITVVW